MTAEQPGKIGLWREPPGVVADIAAVERVSSGRLHAWCRERPSRAKREFVICCNRWRTSQEFVEGARRLKTIK
jgi:hypothetical protein